MSNHNFQPLNGKAGSNWCNVCGQSHGARIHDPNATSAKPARPPGNILLTDPMKTQKVRLNITPETAHLLTEDAATWRAAREQYTPAAIATVLIDLQRIITVAQAMRDTLVDRVPARSPADWNVIDVRWPFPAAQLIEDADGRKCGCGAPIARTIETLTDPPVYFSGCRAILIGDADGGPEAHVGGRVVVTNASGNGVHITLRTLGGSIAF